MIPQWLTRFARRAAASRARRLNPRGRRADARRVWRVPVENADGLFATSDQRPYLRCADGSIRRLVLKPQGKGGRRIAKAVRRVWTAARRLRGQPIRCAACGQRVSSDTSVLGK